MMRKFWIWTLVQMRTLARDERGGNLVEYALLIAIAILVILVAVRNFSEAFLEAVTFTSNQLSDAVNST